MNHNFPTDFIHDYITQNTYGLRRLQTYSIFRFLSAGTKEKHYSVPQLQKELGYTVLPSSFEVISNYLYQDYYFSPAFAENSFDALLLYDAIFMVESHDQKGFSFIKQALSSKEPDLSGSSCDFFGALAILVFETPHLLESQLETLADSYSDEWHFTFEDFVLYTFMDEYFETEHCRNNPKYKELIDTLTIATLKAHDVTLEDAIKPMPFKFYGLHRFGLMDMRNLPADVPMFKTLLEYAITYELRNNLFDFHLDTDRIITLDNWKEKLKWYHTQYDNALELAVSSYFTAMLSRKLLQTQFLENLAIIEK